MCIQRKKIVCFRVPDFYGHQRVNDPQKFLWLLIGSDPEVKATLIVHLRTTECNLLSNLQVG